MSVLLLSYSATTRKCRLVRQEWSECRATFGALIVWILSHFIIIPEWFEFYLGMNFRVFWGKTQKFRSRFFFQNGLTVLSGGLLSFPGMACRIFYPATVNDSIMSSSILTIFFSKRQKVKKTDLSFATMPLKCGDNYWRKTPVDRMLRCQHLNVSKPLTVLKIKKNVFKLE